MENQLIFASALTGLLIIILTFIIRHIQSLALPVEKKVEYPGLSPSQSKSTRLSRNLKLALPDNVIFPHNVAAFKKSLDSYWAQQECEVIPICVVRPHDVQQLCTAVTILKEEYDKQRKELGNGNVEGLFAIRSGGHSPVPGAASIEGGAVLDLSLLCSVTPSEDGLSVAIGAGAKWMDVSKVLDEKNLAVVAGRNSAVGVGGLTLGGGLSFFSPRFGFVCSNIISYEIVLASGSVTTASASTNPDLWRALKGGSNNFGIVTSFVARSFACSTIWSGFIYVPAFQTTKVLAAFHDFVNRADPSNPNTTYDNHAAGPITAFTFVQALGIQVISINLVYTKPHKNDKKWPACWKSSGFASLWRFWSTCKVQTITSATDEMNALNPPGRRQVFGHTTIKNDPATLAAAHAAYSDAITSIRRVKVKDLVWTLVLQPLIPEWARKGDVNPLGMDDRTNEPLVIVSFTINWADSRDDEFIKTTARRTIEEIEAFAAANKTGHRFKYLNYCSEWQRPFDGYGEKNLRFLQGVSKSVDPDGLFQKGCVGGFKLGMAKKKRHETRL